MDSEMSNGQPVPAEGQPIVLELSLSEAQALKARLLKEASDGSSALDDETLKPMLKSLGTSLDYIEGVAVVRRELEQAGLPTERMSDEQVAQLGRKISDAPLRRPAPA
jgi:hypothetical protein